MARLLNKMDKVLLFFTIIMFVFGLLMVYDASSTKSFMEYGVNTKYFSKQLIILIASLFISIFIMIVPTKRYKKVIIPISVVIIVIMLYLLVSGETTAGAKSWLYIGPLGLQPSEFAKIALILFTGIYYRANLK